MGNSPDIVAARQVAEFIGTEHHEVIFTEKDIEEVLNKVIYSLETPDITTIRASVGKIEIFNILQPFERADRSVSSK